MVNTANVDYFVLTGNTYVNTTLIRELGGRWDNGGRFWSIQYAKHPMNNSKQRKKLQAKLNELEEKGVRFIAWYLEGSATR